MTAVEVCGYQASDMTDAGYVAAALAGDARAFTALAAELRVEPAPLAIAWCLRNPRVSSVILGATRVAQLRQNLDALEVGGRMDEAGWARVEATMA